jgi:uncharacterized protein (DUF1330 family)
MRAVYFIASYDITDPERYERDYVPGVISTLTAAAGEVVVASGSQRQLEGASPGQIVVLRFPSEEAFVGWYHGAEYAALRQVRVATTANGTAVLASEYPKREGLAGQAGG